MAEPIFPVSAVDVSRDCSVVVVLEAEQRMFIFRSDVGKELRRRDVIDR